MMTRVSKHAVDVDNVLILFSFSGEKKCKVAREKKLSQHETL